MSLSKFTAFVFQINLVNGFSVLDNRGKIFSEILNFGNERIIENGDTLKVVNDVAEYQLSPISFLVKLKIDKINVLLSSGKQEELIPYINIQIDDFINKSRAICSLLKVSKLNRFACRFIANYPNPSDSDLKGIFGLEKKVLEKDFKTISRGINKNELIFNCSYDKANLILDIDRYINTNQFDIDEIDEKYDIILKQFRDNIFNPRTMVNNLI